MGREAALVEDDIHAPAGGGDSPVPLPLPTLAASAVLIGLAALAFCCLVAIVAVAVLVVRHGADGLADFYQELRFDLRLKTQLGALFIAAFYLGVIAATLAMAAWRGGHAWPRLVAFESVARGRRLAVAIAAVTLGYAAVATLVMSLMQQHKIVLSGPTDMLLLGTIAANLVVLAPCAEELFFRGWFYTGLRHRLPFWPSFLLTTSLFAAIHWDANHRRVFLVLPLAVALGLLREVTASIKPTIALHAIYNSVIVAITLLEA